MDPVHREVLDINHAYLVTHMHGGDLLRCLLNDNIINNYDYEQLRRTEGQGTKAVNRLILLTLRRRGKAAYAGLHKALRQADQDDVCETLLDTELALRDGLAADRAALAKLHNKDQQYMTPRTQGEDKEETIKRLEEQINDLRQSHTQMESELRQQIDKLEKEQKAKAGEKGKNGGGCSVM
nr:hypothetical protein BaRGS_023976 [Batillaria attramentaria]